MGTTINAANLSIGLDVKKLQAGTGLARGEIGKINSIIRQSANPVATYNQELNLLRKAYDTGRIGATQFAQSQEFLKKKIDAAKVAMAQQAEAAKKQARFSGSGPLDAVKQSAGSMASLLGGVSRFAPQLALGLAVKTSLELASGVEQASAAFEVLTGSASSASTMVSQMKKLDAESPLNFLDIQQAGKTLLGYGAATDSVMPRLKQLGDIAMGDGERFKSLSLAFGQVTAAGRLTGQEVLQMVNNGFNPLQEISRNTGLSMIELKKEMENGAISVKMVEDALTSATSAGGRFFGMSDKMSKTGAGAYAKLVSDLQQVGVAIGMSVMPAAKELVGWLRQMIEYGGVLQPVIERFGQGWAVIFATMSGNLDNYLDKLKQAEDEKAQQATLANLEKTQAELNEIAKAQARSAGYWDRISHATAQFTADLEKQKAISQEIADMRIARDRKDSDPERDSALSAYAQIDEEYQRRQIGEEKFARWKIANSMIGAKGGMQEDDRIAQKNALQKFDYIERAKQFEKEKKDKEALAKRLNEENLQAAKRYAEIAETPIDKARKAAQEITNLQKEGFLTSQQANAARMENNKDFQKSRDNGVSATIAPALKAGSAEAYKFILNRKEDAAAAAERKQMLEIQKKQLIEQEKIAANLQPMKAIR
jgi:tape measure domain-containing protein